MGDRLATIDMGRKLGDCAPLGELDPHVTQCRLGRGLPDPCSRLAEVDMGRKLA